MSSRTCYWPNGGGTAKDHIPCKTTSGQSACCKSDHYCFDNGLCLDNSQMTTYRGSCTDRSWGSSACAKYCLTFAGGYVSNGVSGVWVCDNFNHFACDTDSCGNSSRMFIVSGGSLLRNQAVDNALDLSTSTSSSATTASSTGFSTTVTQTQTFCPSSAASQQENCPSRTGALAGIGAGLGIPLLIALMALVVVFMRLRKAGIRHKRQPTHHQGPTNSSEYLQLHGDKPGYMSYTQEMDDSNNTTASMYKNSSLQEAPNTDKYAHRTELATS